jgi:hypothetical protein
MKCPACGFETPDTQNWCDFCKEPFKRPAPAAAPEPAQKTPALDAVRLSEEALRKVITPEKALDLLKQSAGERIPVVPQNIRILAWAFFALVMVAFAVTALVMVRKAQRGALGPNLPGAEAPAVP